MKVTLLGTGAYGLAIASKLASNNINVCMIFKHIVNIRNNYK